MNVTTFFEYLLAHEPTETLAVQLHSAYRARARVPAIVPAMAEVRNGDAR